MPGAGKAYWTACQWRPGVRAGKHTAVSDSAGLFVIFSEVKTDCRRLLLWKILAEIMMEKFNNAKMFNLNGNLHGNTVVFIMSYLSQKLLITNLRQ